MSIKASWGWTVLLAATALVGCSQCRPVVRGQSPATSAPAVAAPAAAVTADCPPGAQGPIIGSAPGYGEYVKAHKGKSGHHDFKVYTGFRDNNFGYEGGYYAGPNGYYTDRDRIYTVGGGAAGGVAAGGATTGCPACEYGRMCPQGGCQHCGCQGACGHGCPQHYQTYRFDWPQNMVYPTSGVPAGMVVYPYYSLKGPSDFFMK